jgi:dsRNA-specific ribonuclease
MARKDAAFQAYVALYNAGLLNDHLLPLLSGDILHGMGCVQDLSSIVQIQQRYNPWYDLAKKWSLPDKCYWKMVNIRCADQEEISMNLLLPLYVPSLQWYPLTSIEGTKYEFSMGDSEAATDTEICDFHLLRAATRMILQSFRGSCATDYPDDFVALFAPQRASQEIRGWMESYSEQSSSTNNRSKCHPPGWKLLHNGCLSRNCSFARSFHPEDGAESIATGSELPIINGVKAIQISETNEKAQVRRLKEGSTAHAIPGFSIRDVEPISMTQLHYDAEKFALFAPLFMHRLEILLVGKELLNRLIPSVQFRSWGLLVEAISASSASELSSNNRLAFLGDTVLDFLVTSQLFATHSIWPAGYLSAKKKLIISNSHLSRMALEVGLDKFILTDPFTRSTWNPPHISDVHSNEVESTRTVPKRTLADTVEALIGAAYLDGQYENAFECTRIFLPEITAHSIGSSFRPTVLACDQEKSAHFALLEELIGYKFRNSALLAEAMTHPSYEQDLTTGSYGRLAFLGNAILSMVVVESLYGEEKSLSSNQMHLLRTATINNGFLAFTCLETYMEKGHFDIQESSPGRFRKVHRSRSIALYDFMRHVDPELAVERSRFLEKHAETCQRIRQALASGMIYPWQDLAKLDPDSCLSDIVQALFGAVYHDSNGDMQQCLLLGEKTKVLPILRQLMRRKVDLLHPKTRLQELAGDQKVTYLVDVEPLRNEHRCIIQINGKAIAEARDMSCRGGVIIRAAELAVMSLEPTSAEK